MDNGVLALELGNAAALRPHWFGFFMRNEPALKFLVPWLCLLSCTTLLSACGGESAPPPPPPVPVPVPMPVPQTCGFGLVYADGGTSGYSVGATPSVSVPKYITPCGLTQVQSVTLGLCVSPADVSELKVQLLSSSGTPTQVSLSSVSAAGSCLLTGTLYNWSLPASILGSGLTDSWRLSVEDIRPGYTSSFFVGWSLEVKGLK